MCNSAWVKEIERENSKRRYKRGNRPKCSVITFYGATISINAGNYPLSSLLSLFTFFPFRSSTTTQHTKALYQMNSRVLPLLSFLVGYFSLCSCHFLNSFLSTRCTNTTNFFLKWCYSKSGRVIKKTFLNKNIKAVIMMMLMEAHPFFVFI